MSSIVPRAPGSRAKLSILIVSDRDEFVQQVRSSLSAVPEYGTRELSVDTALARPLKPQPDLVIVDLEAGELLADQRLFEFRRSLLATPLVAITDQLSPARVRTVVQLNASDLLYQPVPARALLDTVAAQVRGGLARESDVIAFLPCNGGAGASSLAIMAAAERARTAPAESVFLVDLDFAEGSCGLYLDLQNTLDLEGILSKPERIDLELLSLAKRDHASGFSLLSLKRPDLQVSDFGEDFVFRLLDVVTHRYPTVILDLPRYPTRWSMQVARASDRIVLVAEPIVPSLQRAHRLRQDLVDQGAPADAITVVINKARQGVFSAGVRMRDVRRLFPSERIEILPDSYDLLIEALNRGVPPNTVRPRAPIVKKLARSIGDAGTRRKQRKRTR